MTVQQTANGTVTEWPGLTGDDAERAGEMVRLVAERLADPVAVARIAGDPSNREPVYGSILWQPMALSHGYPGTALLYAELSEFDPKWTPALHTHLQAAMTEMPKHPANGLFFGPGAVAAAVQVGAGSVGRYRRLRERLFAWLVRDQIDRLAAHTQRAEAGGIGVSWAAYDVINGLSGTGRLLLAAAADDAFDGAAEALTATLRHLVRLSKPIEVRGVQVPGWWIPPELQPVEEDQQTYPDGDFNLGMAHGVAGPLTLLALAEQHGWSVPGQREAIRRMAEWLCGWVLHDDAGTYWPCRVSWAEQTGTRPDSLFTRTAWCYGAPGVATALYRAGVVFGEESWQSIALDGLRSALRREESQWRLDGPTLCHGYAGFMQILWRIGLAADDPELLAGARRVARRVLDFADPAAPFVFHHVTPDSPEGWRTATGRRELNVAGVLEGAAGVALALLSVTPPRFVGTDSETTAWVPRWDRVLMLS